MVSVNMLLLSGLKEIFNTRSLFSPRDNLLGLSSPGEALLRSVNNYSPAHSKRAGKKKKKTLKKNPPQKTLTDLLAWRSGHLWESKLQTPALMNIELFMCS